jgi:hypothetical protein
MANKLLKTLLIDIVGCGPTVGKSVFGAIMNDGEQQVSLVQTRAIYIGAVVLIALALVAVFLVTRH